ncbi:MAG: excinuclease ABC subunit UvrA [Puniceicoccales bacterium]|jgi:excinuclease ABC subunit A|nr:excinuclease ABC subunit UvrA [Puniceicoccales bacterium]
MQDSTPARRKLPRNGTPEAGARFIRIRGARQNNLQGIDLDIPVGKLVVVTGLSGAGKSSLVFDTLHAEGQRRYVETFSPYTRQFLELLPAPKVDSMENIRPSIAIQQGNTVRTSRSTVGTMTELCDWFKVWFAHRAQLHDPGTGEIIRPHHPQSVWETLAAKKPPGTTVLIGFGVPRPERMEWESALAPFIEQGYTRGMFDGAPARLDSVPAARAHATHCVIIQDRVTLHAENRERFIEAATAAFHLGQGQIQIHTEHAGDATAGTSRHFASTLISQSGKRYRDATPGMFSFNSPLGACPVCHGFGRILGIDHDKVVPDPSRTLAGGAIAPFQGQVYGESQRDLLSSARKHAIPTDIPWEKLTPAQRSHVLDGEPGYGTDGKKWPRAWYGVREFFNWLENTAYKMHVRVFLARYRSQAPCPECHGKRFHPESLCWKWLPAPGATALDLPALYAQPIDALRALLTPHRAAAAAHHPADQALDAILTRLGYLADVGLGYLTLDRQTRTLSGGEVQRVNLTACLGAALADALFVLDEPSVGLHPRDLQRMTQILRRLVEQGNTVVVVEHDETLMRAADHLVEIGPRPGHHGGRLIHAGAPGGIINAPQSATGPWLSGERRPPVPPRRPVTPDTPRHHLRNIRVNNLQGLDMDIPHARFTALCGVSGSGKSTLLNDVLAQIHATPQPAWFTHNSDLPAGEIALVDQSPLSRTPRSNPALYTGAWDTIRRHLANTPEAQAAGLSPSHFSFNSGEGRCPHCGGSGWETVEMQFLADVHIPCPVCDGKRFRAEILAHKHKGKSVAEILALTAEEARDFFDTPAIQRHLALLTQVGLGYLALGQPLNTLSGGEAQRLKLARHLRDIPGAPSHAQMPPPALILLDEPTTGLHREDVARLLALLQRLVDSGHTLVVVEHQTDVLSAADWLIELGPGAGAEGGKCIAKGTPETIAQGDTPTAPYLSSNRQDISRSRRKTPRPVPLRTRQPGQRF